MLWQRKKITGFVSKDVPSQPVSDCRIDGIGRRDYRHSKRGPHSFPPSPPSLAPKVVHVGAEKIITLYLYQVSVKFEYAKGEI